MLLGGKIVAGPEDLAEADLQRLVQDGQEERKTLDYKLELPKDDGKHKFLIDVCSLANTSGGFLIYGMKATKGKPVELIGLANIVPDDEILRLENCIRDGIEPRMSGYWSVPVSLSNGNVAIVIYVPRGWRKPHWVRSSRRFHARDSRGNYDLDLQQIRAAFLGSEALAERLRDYRLDRLAVIRAGDTPVRLVEAPKVAVHVVPVMAFEDPSTIDTKTVMREAEAGGPLFLGASYRYYNFDGVLAYQVAGDPSGRGACENYIQVFRNAIIEAVWTTDPYDKEGKRLLHYVTDERKTIQLCQGALELYERNGIDPPVVIYLSILGVRGCTVSTGDRVPTGIVEPRRADPQPIDRHTLPLPDILLYEYPKSHGELVDRLKPAYDAFWNSMGLEEWLSYKDRRTERS